MVLVGTGAMILEFAASPSRTGNPSPASKPALFVTGSSSPEQGAKRMRSASGTLRRRMHNRGDGRALRLRAGKHSQHLLRIHAQRRCAFLPAKSKRKARWCRRRRPWRRLAGNGSSSRAPPQPIDPRDHRHPEDGGHIGAHTAHPRVLSAVRLPKRPRRRPANSGMIAPRFRNHCTGVH